MSIPLLSEQEQSIDMKKILLPLLLVLGVCGATNAQNVYKELNVYKAGEVTHTIKLSDIDSLVIQNDYEYVDLGLPSGTLWATTNVGASSPSDYGDYFAWGETSPKAKYSWDTYRWGTAYNKLTKYNTYSLSGTVDNKTVLEAEDDAATVNWGSPWRTPTIEEIEELLNPANCTWTPLKSEDDRLLLGYTVKSLSNGNSIFLPPTGHYHEGGTSPNMGSVGSFWSSTLAESGTNRACYLIFNSSSQSSNWTTRAFGLPIRPVRTAGE